MKGSFLFAFAVLVFLTSCGDDPVEQPGAAKSEEYFPLAIGKYVEYRVDSIVFDDAPGGNTQTSVTFLLREEIVDYTVSQLGDTVYYIHRSRRADEASPWILKDVWTAEYNENNVLRTEENLIFKKMTLPVYKDLTWIATSYISPETSVLIGTENLEPYEFWESVVLTVDGAAQVGTFNFPAGNVMEIIQADSDDDLMKRYVHETYARGIGLVARKDSILDSRCIDLGDFGPCIDKSWSEHANKGYILSQVLIGHN